ncbi:secY/secA suppressor protein, partial [Leclercia adecarboxylata ATCC 23216 = NBRC 102595]|nr:secY/secA suppressor protein [Leclercia adecarboxylata ATCC 23216 = NBRC 102595]
MTMLATLEEANEPAREEFLVDNPCIEDEDANSEQHN